MTASSSIPSGDHLALIIALVFAGAARAAEPAVVVTPQGRPPSILAADHAYAGDTVCREPLFGRPTAVVAPDETFTVGVLRFCHRRGLRVPHDLSLASAQNYIYAARAHDSDLLAGVGCAVAPRCANGGAAPAGLDGRQAGRRARSWPARCDVQWTDSVGPAPEARTTLNAELAANANI